MRFLNGFLSLARLEALAFRARVAILLALLAFTALMAVFSLQLRMDAGFEKQIPSDHEYVATQHQYRDELFGANRLNIVLRARHGSIWTKEGLTRLNAMTQAVMFLPNVNRLGVQSLWTPNTFVNEITEEGFRADPVIAGTVTPESLTPEVIASIRDSANNGGFVGTLVSRKQDSAMIIAEINEFDANGKKVDYLAYNKLLNDLRAKYENGDFEVQIIGFAKQIGDVADGAQGVLKFCIMALLLTALAVYWYCRSLPFTLLPIVCSLVSLVWQFGTLHLLGYGLDPLAVLVPFLVFAIGVSHGVQQINYIVRGIAAGMGCEEAARASFRGLLVPGVLALVTAFVSFITLTLIPIPMVKELAITASIGVGYKIITNLVMLPLAASLLKVNKAYADAAMRAQQKRARWLQVFARAAHPRNARVIVVVTLALFAASVWYSSDRLVGTLQAGAPELRADSRYNLDAKSISDNYDTGLDWLSVILATPENSCDKVAFGRYQEQFDAAMRHVPGVMSVSSFAEQMKIYNEGYNEGNPSMYSVPLDPANYAALAVEIGRVRGFLSKDCSMLATHLYLTDHKASTINGIIAAVKQYRAAHPLPGLTIRLAAGNAGVIAAVNEEVEKSELPMMLYVYAAIIVLVFAVYRDLRAVVACCLPLTVATFIGYAFMKQLQIGLTVATLPVMVLAVGIGVDYAFYIYSRLQMHLAAGEAIAVALEKSIQEIGVATIFTAITLAIGVATWSFSQLKFQADMGKLLAFMFIVNLIMAMTALPAFAVVLERMFPRKGKIKVNSMMNH
ncbi:putative RND superfamily exporter protein [Herbaspirillum seropedicae]|uniref:efflux RND transporter permease subunit n=1 Tax=Herbaspirillum seropedicae TaxID=964 RepID=UPI0008481BA3|nr:efflux RND transporter permease subunit [Herbaspirillum seropedicae]AON56309.1 protein exporter of the Resistance-Nodulation-Cell Division (RND) superfamily protein [Herbaspirillum seropedicae]MDR6396207.1 putative RND superfamily exporter protein [Herbaspirillum seropedicae]